MVLQKSIVFAFTGGWTQVLHVTSDTNDTSAFLLEPIKKISTISGFKVLKKYGMLSTALAELQSQRLPNFDSGAKKVVERHCTSKQRKILLALQSLVD